MTPGHTRFDIPLMRTPRPPHLQVPQGGSFPLFTLQGLDNLGVGQGDLSLCRALHVYVSPAGEGESHSSHTGEFPSVDVCVENESVMPFSIIVHFIA